MILVYTNKLTSRVQYTFQHLFENILKTPVTVTCKVEEFVAYSGAKFSYLKSPLGNEFCIKCHDLLFEQGVNDVEVQVFEWENIECFFSNGVKGGLPFDLFAASFYLLSRYEEYLPHVKDEHERYPAHESLAYKNNFLEKPIIDIWAYKLLDILKEQFPEYKFKNRTFSYKATIDIDVAYAYKNKGMARTSFAFVRDLLFLRFLNVLHRLQTLLNIKKDSFDTYDYILDIHQKFNIQTTVFASVGDYSTFDKNVSYNNSQYHSTIKRLADYLTIGLHPSYFAFNDEKLIKKEKQRLENIVNIPIEKSRQHYLKISIPETYQHLMNLGIVEDYSMGYPDHVGFRAGTCTSFYFYNLNFELKTPLKIIPFAFMDVTLKNYMKLTNEKAYEKIGSLSKEVKKVNGTLVSLFHNETFSEKGIWKGWTLLYERFLNHINTKVNS